MIFRPGLTARHVIQNLGEHALAFWNFYNTTPLSEEELDKELSEDSINGILLITAYSEYVTEPEFERRIARLVELSEGHLSQSTALNLLAKALGHKVTGGTSRSRAFLGKLHSAGRVENLNWGDRHTAIPKLLKRHSQDQTKLRPFASEAEARAALDAVVAELRQVDSVTSKDLAEWKKRIWKAHGDLALKTTKRAIAHALGYRSWKRMKPILEKLGYVPNILKRPNAEVQVLLDEFEAHQAELEARASENKAERRSEWEAGERKIQGPTYRAPAPPALPTVTVRKKRTINPENKT